MQEHEQDRGGLQPRMQSNEHTERTPTRRAQRWFGALAFAPLLLGGALLALHGCTLPAAIQPITVQAASDKAAMGGVTTPTTRAPLGEPEVEIVAMTPSQPSAVSLAESAPIAALALAAPTVSMSLSSTAPMAARDESSAVATRAGETTAAAQLGGLAGAALAASTALPSAMYFPTATPTAPAEATEAAAALSVSPLPTTAAASPAAEPEATRSITEALQALVPVTEAQPEAAEPPTVEPATLEPATPAAPPPVETPAAHIEPTPDGVARTAAVPILMYHYVSTPPGDADIYRRDLSVSPDLFAAQLDRLQADGYTTISLYDLMANLTQGAPLPEKPVILTFDDGYRDLYENALPRLRERGMVATVFVLTDFMDEGRPEYLTWDMARALLAAGISIESHGRNHVSLRGKENDYLIWQALGSDQTIEYELGVRPRFVSYPAGEFDQSVIDIFQSAKYWAGVTTAQGATHRSDDPYRLARIRVRGTTSPDDLAKLLDADW